MECICLSENTPFSPRQACAIWANAVGVFIFGGQDQNLNYLNDVWRFDLTHHCWQLCRTKNPPTARTSCAFWQDSKGYFYIFGGLGLINETYQYLNDMWRLDPFSHTWTQIDLGGFIPKGRQDCHIWQDASGQYVFMHGGLGAGIIHNDFWCFSYDHMTWFPLPTNDMASYGGAFWYLENRLYLCGGIGVHSENFCIYDLHDKTWQVLGSFPISPYLPLCWSSKNLLHMWSGFVPIGANKMDCPESGWTFDPIQNKWYDFDFTYDFAISKRYRSMFCSYNDQHFVFGGCTQKNLILQDLWKLC